MTAADASRRFTAIYDAHHAQVYAYAVSRAGRQLADDIVGDTFLRAWRGSATVPAAPLPWLLGIARNVVRERYRDEVRQASLAAELGAWVDEADADVADGVAERAAMLSAVARLREADREVLTLMAWHGLEAREPWPTPAPVRRRPRRDRSAGPANRRRGGARHRRAGAGDRAGWRADGSPTEWIEPPPRGLPDAKQVVIRAAAGPRYARPIEDPRRVWTYPIGGSEMTAAQLAGLPTDPARLKAWLLQRFQAEGDLEATDYALFWSGRHLVFDLPVPPRVRSAAYRMLADVKGVRFLGPATDQRGRSGMAVAYARKGDGGSWSQTRLIIDSRVGQALAEESWNLGRGRSPAPTGELTSYTLVLSAGFRDDAPPAGLPTRPAEK